MIWLFAGVLALIALLYFLGRLSDADPEILARRLRWILLAGIGVLVLLIGVYLLLSGKAIGGFAIFAPLFLWGRRALQGWHLWRWLRRQREQFSASGAGGMSIQEAARILGVSADASEAAIEAAWQREIRQHHPDRGGEPNRASQINQARDVLLRKRKGKNS